MREIKFLDKDDLRPEIGITVGTRPGIVMLAPVIHEFRRRGLPHFVVHTGQHYSPNMDAQFFTDLELPAPDYRIEGVAEKRTHGGQTAAMLEGVEKILMERRPFFFLVGGDANTNLAAALAARKLRIRLGHIEGGERCFDWDVPEEHNRVMIDHISEHLFATSEQSAAYLRRESVLGEIHVVGNPKVDASKQFVDIAWSQRVNLFYLWPFMEIIPVPLSAENEAYLHEVRRIVDYAQNQRGMEVWIMQSANRIAVSDCGTRDPRVRTYWVNDCQKDMNPADPQQFERILKSFEALYRIVNNADAFCMIDSDPGGWPNSPLSDQVKIFHAARKLLDRYNVHAQRTKLVDFMWIGWGRHILSTSTDRLVRAFDWTAKNPEL